MKFFVTQWMLGVTACTLLFLLAPDSTNAFGGHLIGRPPTTAFFVPQPMVPAPTAPTVTHAPMMIVPAAPVSACRPPAVAVPAPMPVTSYYYAPAAYHGPTAPVAAPARTTTFYVAPTVAPATVVYYPVWLPRRRVSPIHGY